MAEPRVRGQKLNEKKLTALERLKKARQGEKIDEPEEPEEELYDYVEEDDYEEEERYVKKNKSSGHENHATSSASSRSKNLTRSKVTGSPEENKNSKQDIRDAFFKASTSSKVKLKSNVEPSVSAEQSDKLMDEIMQELTNKKASKKMAPAGVKPMPSPLPRPAALPRQSNSPYIPFSTSSLLSPSRKRKLDTDVIMGEVSNGTSSNHQTEEKKEESSCKKISLEPELMQAEFMQQLLDDDSNPTPYPPVKIKSEPIVHEQDHDQPQVSLPPVKSEKIEYDEHDEEAELLSQLSLEATNSSMMHIKQEILNNTTEGTQLQSTASDAELSAQLKSMDTANKILVYWMDTYEDQFNSHGTVYVFGRMPVVTKTGKDDTESLSFVSVCCIVKNIPKVVYVLPRKYRKTKNTSDRVPVTLDDAKKEVEQVLEKNKIYSYQIKTVKKYLAFDKPNSSADDDEELATYENECLQVEFQYDPKHMAQLNLASMEGECFSAIFNSNSSHMEHLLIDLKLKGPGWLTIQNAKRRDAETSGLGSMVSWCKVEYVVENYRYISTYHESTMLDHPNLTLPGSPPLTMLTLLLRTMLNTRTQEHEIVCAIGLVTQKFCLDKATMPSTINKQQTFYDSYFCALTKSSDVIFPFDLQKQLNLMKESNKGMRVELCGSERALLAFLLGKMQSFDVDVIVGHDLFGFNLDILLNRCGVNKVPHWSRMGRLKRSQMPNEHVGKKGHANQNFNHGTMNLIIQQRIQTVCAGRLLCDVMISAKELLTKCKSFDLNELVSHILFRKDKASMFKRDLDQEKNIAAYYANSGSVIKFLQLAMLDATYILKICNDLQCLQLAYQITCIAGNVLSRTLTGGRSERNEYLLLHAFYDRDFILPEKQTYQSKKKAALAFTATKGASKKPSASQSMANHTIADEDREDEMLSMMEGDNLTQAMVKSEKMDPDEHQTTTAGKNKGYAGGLVLEPKVGFYDKFILLLDFNSLYPSIIQEYNICFTTISRPPSELLDRDVEEYIETCIRLPGPEEKPGILPLEIKKLVDSRRAVKNLMQDKNLATDLKMQYDIRQKALKLTANSLYGCLGFENSRFYCKPLAALITKLGRKLLMKTKELVESKKIDVIYGDTDSIMINTNLTDYDQVIKLGTILKSEVNKLYKHLEIDIDGVFKCLLLLRKKKYAALTIQSRNPNNPAQFEYLQEIKGLDVVRRDWCILAKQIGERVIGEILSGQNYEIVLSNINKILNETAEKIKNNMYDLSLFEISKQLNRNPEDYSDANHQSHVLVALRHNKDNNNSKKYKTGDVVSYLICEDGTSNSATQRAYSRAELVKSPDKLTLDTKYYLTQQIHPIVTRLCEPIEGIDQYHIAESLGLDPSGFRQKSSSSNTVSIARPTLTGQQKRLESLVDELAKYVNSVPFKYICPGCKTEANWQSLFTKQEGIKSEVVQMDQEEEIEIDIDESALNVKPTASSSSSSSGHIKCILDTCSNSACKVRPVSKLAYIKNLLTLQMSKYIKQYYQGWLVCDDPLCSFRTKRISCKFFHNKPQCIECEKYNATLEYSHADLFNQLRFLRFLFDSDAYKSSFKDDAVEINNYLRTNRDIQLALIQLKEHVNKKIKENSYSTVDMTSVFRSLTSFGL